MKTIVKSKITTQNILIKSALQKIKYNLYMKILFFLTHLIQNITQKQYFLDLTLSSNIYLLMIKMPVIPFKMFTQTWAKFGFPLSG